MLLKAWAPAEVGHPVLGVGVDLCSVAEVAAALREHPGRYQATLLGPGDEAADLALAAGDASAPGDGDAPARRLAATFAVKEAVTKALRPAARQPWRWSWVEVDLPRLEGAGAHRVGVRLHGGAAALAVQRGVSRIDAAVEPAPLHSTHARAVATAIAR